jgi:hypothetical protein
MAKNSEWYQGKFIPEHPEKCLNNNTINFRSSYEKRFLVYCDGNQNVIKYGYEVVQIPYFFEIDSKTHKYIVDFYVEIKNSENQIKKYLIEIKPEHQTMKPREPKKKSAKSMKNYMYAAKEYIKNQNKWSAAKMYCEKNGFNFKLLNEKTLF